MYKNKELSIKICLNILIVFCFFMVFKTFGQQDDKITKLLEMSTDDLWNIKVITASRFEQKAIDAPATIIVITDQQIEQNGWRDLKDILRSIPGIDISYYAQGELKSIVTMRGILGNQKMLILQDGNRMVPITGERIIYGHNMPLTFIKRIEIVYGPATALYGAEAYAGVINMITKNGNDINGIELHSEYSTSEAFIGNIIFGKEFSDDTEFIIGGRIYYGEDVKLNEDYKSLLDYGAINEYHKLNTPKFPIKNWNLFTKIKYKKFLFGGNWQHLFESNAYSTIPSLYCYTEDFVWSQELRHFFIKHNTIEKQDFKLSNKIVLGDYTVNPESNFTMFTGEKLHKDPEKYNAFKYAYSSYWMVSSQFDWKINENILLNSGFSFKDVFSFPKTKNLDYFPYSVINGYEDDLSDFTDESGFVYGKVGLTDTIFGTRNYYNFGLFTQAVIKSEEKFTFTVGLRYDYNSIYGSTVNPRIGIVYRPNNKIYFKTLYGTAYISPSNYFRWENWAAVSGMHIPNEEIEPEKIKSYEINIGYYLNQNYLVSISLFRNDMTDIIRPIQLNYEINNDGHPYYNPLRLLIGQTVNSGFVETNMNKGEIYSQGIEISINADYSNFDAKFTLSYLDGEDNESMSAIPKVSTYKANLNIGYRVKNFYSTLLLRYFSDIEVTSTNSLYGIGADKEGEKIPGATILYGNLGYKIYDNLWIKLSVENIFNTKHYGAAPYAESGWIQPRSPQALRKIFIGMKYSF